MLPYNFIYAYNKESFLRELDAGNIQADTIVFIEDTKEIWNNGTYFAGDEQIKELKELIASVQANSPFIVGEGSDSAVQKNQWGANTAGNNAFATGFQTIASGDQAHTEGYMTQATAKDTHAEGHSTVASDHAAHAEGYETESSGWGSHSEGLGTVASGAGSHAEGATVTLDNILYKSIASNDASHAEGRGTLASGISSHSEGTKTTASGLNAHSEGDSTIASADNSHVEGCISKAYGWGSHAEGYNTTAKGSKSHSEGDNTIAFGENSHAEGNYGQAIGFASHAEGDGCIAFGAHSHAEGFQTKTTREDAHAEGHLTESNEHASHAEGYETKANGWATHTEGVGTTATNHNGEHAEGKYNKSNTGTIHSVGIGSSTNERKNAHEIMQDGKHYILGIGGYDGTNLDKATDVASQFTELSEEINKKQGTITDLETIRSGAEKGATAIQEVKTINGQSLLGEGNIVIEGGGDSYDDTEIKQEIKELSDEVVLRNIGAEDVGESVEEPIIPNPGFSTPSGDPMHYMFELAKAVYNATDEDIPMVGIYGDSYVHKARHWHLNELGDLTNEEMRDIFARRYSEVQPQRLNGFFQYIPTRTTMCFSRTESGAHSASYTYFQANDLETIGTPFSLASGGATMLLTNASSLVRNDRKLRKILSIIDLSYVTAASSIDRPFEGTPLLEELRVKNLKFATSFKDSPLLSYASIKYIIANNTATSQITLTLHADALANANSAYLADGKQDHTTYPTLSDWALSKNIQIATA